MRKITSHPYKKLLFFVIILATILSTSVSFSQEEKDRNGNGIVEESDYWTTSEKYSEEYIKSYNARLEKKYNNYWTNTPIDSQDIAPNLMPIGSCNLLSCGSFLYSEANFNSDWGGERIGVDGVSRYGANVSYDCWDDDGTVDWSEGQYISYSNSNANIETPGIIEQSNLDGGGFSIFSYKNETINQDITVQPNTNYTVCFEIAVIPRYSNDDGDYIHFQPNLQFGIASGGVVISDPLTYTHNDLNIHPASDFPDELSTATSGNGGFQNPGGWTEIDPFWENVCITFKTDNSGTVNVFYATGDPGRSVVLVDGLRLSLEGYANAPTLSSSTDSFCLPDDLVDLDNYITSTGATGATLTWSTNSDPSVITDHLASSMVNPPGIWYAFYYNTTFNCFSPSVALDLSLSPPDCTVHIDNCPDDINECFDGDGLTPVYWDTPSSWYQCCGDSVTGGSSFDVQFNLPESQNSCWIYNNTQRIGSSDMRLNQSATAVDPPLYLGTASDVFFVAPLQFFDNTVDIPINHQLLNSSTSTVSVDWRLDLLLFDPVSGTYSSEWNSTDTTVLAAGTNPNPSETPWTIIIPANSVSNDEYKLKFSYTGLTDNKVEVDFINYNAILAGSGCTAGINFVTTASHNPGDEFPIGTTQVTYTATLSFSGNNAPDPIVEICTFDVNIFDATQPVSTGDITECEEDPIQTLDANDAITPITGQNVVWYTAETGGTVVTDPTLNALGTVTYWAEGRLDGIGCKSERTSVILTLNAAPTVTISGDPILCGAEYTTLTAVSDPTNVTYAWYNAADPNTVIGTNSSTYNATEAGTYYVIVNFEGCETQSDNLIITETVLDDLEVTCPENVTVDCNDDIAGDFANWLGGFSYTGGADPVVETYTVTVNGQPAVYGSLVAPSDICTGAVIVVTLQVTDDCNQDESCSSIFTLTENKIQPTASNLDAISVSCIEDIPDPDITLVYDAGDYCGTFTVTHQGDSSNNDPCEPTITRTYRITNSCNLFIDVTQIITVESLDFTIDIPDGGQTVECLSDANIGAVTSPTVTDNCNNGLTPVMTGPFYAPDPFTCEGTVTYTWTYTDCIGNGHTWNYVFTVDYTGGITAPADATETVECVDDATLPSAPSSVDDSCGNAVVPVYVGVTSTPDPITCEGTVEYKWSYTDCTGDVVDYYTYTYTIDLTTSPVVNPTTGSDTVECEADASAPQLPTIVDSCDNEITPTGGLTTEGNYDGCEGTIVYRYTYTDCAENSTDYVFTYTIELQDFEMPDDGASIVACSIYAIEPITPTVIDNCGNEIIPTGPILGGTYVDCGGTITYTYMYTDCEGNNHEWVYTYTIYDTTNPVIDIESSDLTVECDGEGNLQGLTDWLDSNGGGSATDTCSDVTWSNDFDVLSDDCGATGSATVIFTATDVCGNYTTTTATFTIEDTTAPILTTPIDEELTVSCSEIPDVPNVEFEDSCSTEITINFEETSTFNGEPGDYTIIREWSAIDECGNEEIVIQTIIVIYESNVTGSDIELCNDDLPIDLFTLLNGDFTTNGVWEVTQGDATLDEGIFDPTTVELGNYIFTYTDANNPCPTVADVIIEVINCITIQQVIELELEKSGVWNDENGDLSVNVGETISYTFSVTNVGNFTAYNITIDDPLPGIVIEGGPIAVLLPGETDDSTFTATYVITQADIDNGEVVNQAIVNGENEDGIVYNDESDDPSTEEPNDPTVVILPFVEGITFEIFNGVTPNGDGFNDYFQIDGIDQYPNNNIKIYNRWGILIWETNGYGSDKGGNVFTGDADARMMIEGQKDAPTGTYFYILTFSGENPGKNSYSGYLYLNR